MSGMIMASITRPVASDADEGDIATEKVAAYWDFLSHCAKHDHAPMSEAAIIMDTDFDGNRTITVTGWVYHRHSLANVSILLDPNQPTLFDQVAIPESLAV